MAQNDEVSIDQFKPASWSNEQFYQELERIHPGWTVDPQTNVVMIPNPNYQGGMSDAGPDTTGGPYMPFYLKGPNGNAIGATGDGKFVDSGMQFRDVPANMGDFFKTLSIFAAAVAGGNAISGMVTPATGVAESWMQGAQAGSDAINAGNLTQVAGDATNIGNVAQQAASAGIPWKEIGQGMVQIGKYVLPIAQAALAVQALTSGNTSAATKILATAALVDSTGRIINQATANTTPVTNNGTQQNTQQNTTPITNNQIQLPGGNSNMESLGQSLSKYGISVGSDGTMTANGQPVTVDDSGNVTYTNSGQPFMYDDGSGVPVPLNTSNVNTINNQVKTDSNGNIITPSTNTNTTGNQTTNTNNYPTLPDGSIDWTKLLSSVATGAAQYGAFTSQDAYKGGASQYMTNAGFNSALNSLPFASDIGKYAGYKPGGIGPMPTDLYNTYKNFLQNPADMATNPMFSAFNTQQQQATERALQARGMNSSGNMVQQLGQNAMANWAQYYPQLANTLQGGAQTEASNWNTANTANLNAGQLGTTMYNTLTNANNQAGQLGLGQYNAEAQSQLARGAVAAQIAGGTVNSAASAFDPAQQAVSKYLTNYFTNLGKTN